MNNSKEKTTLEGKFNKLVDAKVLLLYALFTYILSEAKKFSLVTQKSDINIIGILDFYPEQLWVAVQKVK